MQTTGSISGILDPTRLRASGVDLINQQRTGQTSSVNIPFFRGALAKRAYSLLGIGSVGSARLSQSQDNLCRSFGGDAQHWQQLGTPWIAARSLTKPADAQRTQSASAWLLAGRPGTRSGNRL